MSVRITPLRSRKNTDDGVLPLINIVFLLLIFFMIVGRISARDPFPIAPPNSSTEAAADIEGLTLFIGRKGELALDGAVMDETHFEKVLSERLAEQPNRSVWLKADGQAEAALMIKIMETLHRLGVDHVRLLTVAGAS